ncbi:MAG: CvpA family protein [Paludibacteraceae bacterium]|nr:CvpA family protein [Paludibacteraceae bacterium]
MNALDIVLLIILAFGTYRGFRHGLMREIATVVILVAGVFLTKRFAPYVATMLVQHEVEAQHAHTLSYIIAFILIAIAIRLCAGLLTRLIESIDLGVINTLGGLLFGLMKYALTASIIINAIFLLDTDRRVQQSPTVRSSHLCQPIARLASVTWDELKDITSNNP